MKVLKKGNRDQVFVKHIPTQTFCAIFANEAEYSNYLRGKDEQTRKEYWPYKREHVKKFTGLNPDNIVIHRKYLV